MNIFEEIIELTEALLEDYETYKDKQEEIGTEKSYTDLAKVNNSIRRNKTKVLKAAAKDCKNALKKELSLRNSGALYQQLQASKAAEEALDKYKNARSEEREAFDETEKARARAARAAN